MSATTSSTATTFYTRSPDGTILAGRVGSSTWFYVTEPNGNVAYLTDVNGAVLGGYDYSPYGATTVIGGADFNPLRWLSAHQETATSNGDDVYKLGARYHLTSGAFTQPDAIGGDIEDPRTMTAYNYGAGDPINNFDPSGYAWWDDAWDWTVGAFSSVPWGCALNYGAQVAATGGFLAAPFTGGLSAGIAVVGYAAQSYSTYQSCR